MKKNYLGFILPLLLSSAFNILNAQDESGIFESYIIIDSGFGSNWYDLNPHTQTGLFDFNGSDLGTFNSGDTFVLNGGQNRIWKCGTHNITSSWLNYRIYPTGSPSGTFIGINLNNNVSTIAGAACGGSGDNQDWTTDNNLANNVLALLGTAYGTYTIEVYTLADYTYTTGSGVHYINNGGANYTATFLFCDDTVGPVLDPAPADVTVECMGDEPTMIDLAWTDNCDGVGTVTGSDGALVGGECGGTITRTWSYTDSHGNPATQTQTITIDDTIAPVFAAAPSDVTVECIGDVPVMTDLGWTDNCDGSGTVTGTDVSDNASCPETITRTWTYTDACGNPASATQTITIDDTIAPVFAAAPSDVTVECIGDVPAMTDLGWTDNCDGSGTVTGTDVSDNASCPETITRTWTYTDACGNPASATQTITIDDTIAPVFAAAPTDVTVECIGDVPAMTDLGWTDNCDGSGTVTGTDGALSGTACGGTITRTWTYTDACGNPASATQTITIDDTIAPVFAAALSNVTVECIGNVPVMTDLGWTDNCDGSGTVTGTDGALSGTACGGTITRTWTYTDACGNPASATQTITIDDTIAPVFAAAPSDVTVECIGDVPAMTDLGWTDNCDGSGSVTGTDVSDNASCPETITRTWTYTDACGNPASATQTITIDDTIAPVFAAAPSDVTVECIGDVPAMTDLGWTDNCDGSGSVTGTDVSDNASCPETITRTWTYTDACGNPASATQTITIDDTIAPVFAAAPSDVTVECIGDVPAMTDLGWTDNCDGSGSVTGTDVSDNASCPETITRTWTYTDACGNPASATQTITIDDTIAPVFAAAPSNVTVECIGDVPAMTDLGWTDNCDGSGSVTGTDVSDNASCPETITRTWTYTDACGNPASATQTITIDDTIAPVFAAAPSDVTVECIGDVPAMTDLGWTDNCDGSGSVTGTDVSDNASCPETITRTWTYTDACGNPASATQTITIDDTIAPVFAAAPSDVTVECIGDVPAMTDLGWTDNCDGSGSVTGTDVSDNASCPETITRTWTYTDACGNPASATQTITIDDTIAPVFAAAPSNVTVECIGDVPAMTDLGWTDNCDGSGSVTGTDVSDNASCPETITRTWTYTDACGNPASATQTITIDDTIAPVFAAAPSNVTVECIGDVPAMTDLGWTDNCDGSGSVTGTDVSDNASCPETITRTWTYTDACGNPASATQIITVDDSTSPTASNPSPINVQCISAIPAININVVTDEADNCGTPSVTFLSESDNSGTGSTASPYILTRIYRVTDTCGNITDVSHTLTAIDNTPPIISCPSNINNVYVDAGLCTAVVNYSTPSGTDNCPGQTTAQTAGLASGSAFPVGTTTNTFVVTDAAGNTATCSFTVTVIDDEDPTITCPSDISNVSVDAGQCSAVVSYVAPIGADNCPGQTTAQTAGLASGSAFPVGTTTNTFVVTDAAGNTATCSFTVTVIDDEDPTITCPSDISNVSVDAGQCSAVVSYVAPVGADNCPGQTTAQTAGLASGSAFPVGTTTNTFVVTDAAGNTATCSFTVTVIDDEDPVIVGCPSNIILNNDSGLCSAVATWSEPTAIDNCTLSGSLVWTKSHLPGAIFSVGTTTVTYTAMDASGNIASCSFTVTINDNEIPTITCPSNIVVNNDANVCGARVSYNINTTDNCSGQTFAQTAGLASGSIFPVGTTTNTFVVTDASGNTATCSFDVTVIDNEIPKIFGCPTDITVGNDTDSCDAVVNYSLPTATDNCDPSPSIVQTSGLASGATYPLGTTTNTFEITDLYGNIATCSFEVTVNDTQDPVTPNLPTLTGQCSVTVTAPTTTDNCAGTITGTTGDYGIPHTFNSDGNYTINWQFDDGNGNTIIETQTIIVDDTTPPVPNVASLPDINVVDCEVVLVRPTATDNCRGQITATTDVDIPFTTFGTTIVTWTYDDKRGQIVTQQQSVTLTKPPISGGVLLGQIDDLDPIEFPPSNNVPISACPDNINPVTINLSGENGTIVRWEKFEAGGNNWTIIPNTTNSHHIDFDFASSLSTVFRVLVQWGTCKEYSQIMSVHAVPPDVPPTLENDYFNTCLGTEISLLAYSGYTSIVDPVEEEAGQFDQGQFPDKWNPNMWKIDGQVAGVAFTGAANNRSVNNWTATNNHPFPDGTWTPKIEYDSNNFKFAIAQGDFTSQEYIDAFPPGNPTTLETPIMSLLGLESPTFSFTQAWNLFSGDIALLELSLDGGLTYTITLQDLTNPIVPWNWSAYPPSTANNFEFNNSIASFDLSAYSMYDQVRIRWTFFGTSPFSAWAIDEIILPLGGSPANEIEWTDGIGDPNEEPLADGTLSVAYTFTPDAPGHHQYGATTLVNGCRAYDPAGTALADVLINYAYAGEDILYAPGECGENLVVLNAYDNTLSAIANAAKGAFTLPPGCINCDDNGTMTPGKWTVVNSTLDCGTGGSFSNVADPNATFTGDPGTYTLRWTVGPFGPDNSICFDDVDVQITNCAIVDFDGENDNVTFNNNYNLNPAFSIECWIKPDATTNTGGANNAIQTIISKRNANNFANSGYDLRLDNNVISFRWNNSGSISSPFPIDTNRWYHIAITREAGNNSTYRMYIDGIQVRSLTGSNPNANSNDFVLGAMDQAGNPPNKPVNYFSGWIDEVRIWNKTLNVNQIRQMMNQQIDNSGGNVIGDVIPLIVRGPDANQDGIDDDPVTWANLVGYYRMDQIDCGYLEAYKGGIDGKLRHISSQQEESAPLPYTTKANGNWNDTSALTPWSYGDTVWDFPNALGVNGTRIDWNIVRTSHNVTSDTQDVTLLGLLVQSNELTITDTGPQDENNNGHGLNVSHYLKLDGVIDLVGESQLVQRRYATNQFNDSQLDPSSNGYLERDQQGTTNLFNYNYWCSPVSTINNTANNIPYAIDYALGGVLRGGYDSNNPTNIAWVSSYDAGETMDPISTSNRWLYAYENYPQNTYAEWRYLSNSGSLAPGLGFTMKGSGYGDPVNDVQNYVFTGKPNIGPISTPITTGNEVLAGNPFPSALDAREFIKDNIPSSSPSANPGTSGSTMGSLYFWIHYNSNYFHILRDYQGGYAVYNLSGGIAAVTPLETTDGYIISGSGSSTLIPGQYVPVGQGFFVISSPSGGNVTFQNDQRFFRRESLPTSVFLRMNDGGSSKEQNVSKNDDIKRVRINFESPEGATRPLLLAFVPDNQATDGFDYGYDAEFYDGNSPNYAAWIIGDKKYVIQGVGDFDKEKKYPIGMNINLSGTITVSLADLENFEGYKNVYVYDSLLDRYTKINNKSYKINLDKGEYLNRFYITFTKAQNNRLDTDEMVIEDPIVNYLNKTNEIYIHVPFAVEVEKVYLTNLLGQTVRSWNTTQIHHNSINEFKIPVKDISEGYYIINVETNVSMFKKKVIISNME